MSLQNSRVAIAIQHKNVKTLDYGSLPDDLNLAISQDFAAGVASEGCDLVFGPDKRTLAGGATESLNLFDGSLLDNLGNACPFRKVRALVIENLSSTKILTIGNDANPFVFLGAGTHTVVLAPKGKLALANPVTGWTVTETTGDQLKIANNAGDPADYLVYLLGTSS